MPRSYTVREFFRQMPTDLLHRYFGARRLFVDLNFDALLQTQPDTLFDAWIALPPETRASIDAEFREIFDLSGEKGFRAIQDEAAFRFRQDPADLKAFVAQLADLPGHFERAMTTFLDHPDLWPGALQFFHADSLTYWRKRGGFPKRPAALDHASRQELQRSIGTWFHESEGRGRDCKVEVLRRDDRDYFFTYPADYGQQSLEWEAGQFRRRAHQPAFEVVFLWSERDGTLDIHHDGAATAIEPLQGIFARTILKLDELPPDPKDKRVYDLEPLRRRAFQFVYAPDSGIHSVAVRKLRLAARTPKGHRIVFEADPSEKRLGVYDLLEAAGQSLPLAVWNVTQAEITAKVQLAPHKPPKTETFRITWPNGCTLKYDEAGLKLRAMLQASGIEPRESFVPLLDELLARVGAAPDGIAFVGQSELSTWPAREVDILKEQGMLVAAAPAHSAVCPGCERQCTMPVHVPPSADAGFVVCDKRPDINRVPLSLEQLRRWQASGEATSAALTRLLALRLTEAAPTGARRWPVGMLKKGAQAGPLVLGAQDGLVLSVAGHSLPIGEVLGWRRGRLEVQRQRLMDCLANPVPGAGGLETPAQRKERLMKRRDALQASGERNFLKVLAKEEGFAGTSRVKQLLYPKKGPPTQQS